MPSTRCSYRDSAGFDTESMEGEGRWGELPLAFRLNAPQFADESTGGVTFITLWAAVECAFIRLNV